MEVRLRKAPPVVEDLHSPPDPLQWAEFPTRVPEVGKEPVFLPQKEEGSVVPVETSSVPPVTKSPTAPCPLSVSYALGVADVSSSLGKCGGPGTVPRPSLSMVPTLPSAGPSGVERKRKFLTPV